MKIASIVLRIAISALLLALLFRQPVFGQAQWQLLREHWHWVIAGLLSAGGGLILSALRWWIVLRGQLTDISFATTLRTTLIAWFFNITSLGTIGGDAYRVLAIGTRHAESRVKIGVSVIVDHAAGLIGLMLLFLIIGPAALWLHSDHDAHLRPVLASGGLMLLLSTVLMTLALLSLSPPCIRRFGHLTPKILVPLRDRLAAIGFTLSACWQRLIVAGFVSLPVLVLHFGAFYCGLRAVGGEASLISTLIAMPLVDMAASLPVSVSGLGVREHVFEWLMSLLAGVPAATSIAASLAGWLFTVFWGLVGGLAFMVSPRVK